MTLAEFAKESAGVGNFLRSQDIHNGLKGSILRPPTTEKRDFQDGKGEKLVANFSMSVEDKQEEQIWSPGKNAVRYLFEAIGGDEKNWKYPIEGHFEARNVQTKQGSRLAWLFIPDQEVKQVKKGAEVKSEFSCGVPDCGEKFDSIASLQKHIRGHK
mgnify:FL=1